MTTTTTDEPTPPKRNLSPSEWRKNVARLLDMLTPGARCKYCARPVWFLRHRRTGGTIVITDEAISHFADCPYWQKARKGSGK